MQEEGTKAVKFCAAALATSLTLVAYGETTTRTLTLTAAEKLASVENPSVQVFKAQAASHLRFHEAVKELPAPVIRTGLLNVPVDGLALHAEPMTQGVIGVRQVIPPKAVRQAQSVNHEFQAQAMQELAVAELKDAVYETRVAWLNVHAYQHEIELTTAARELLGSLTQIVRARYASGEELQLAVLAADLERNRLESRLLDTQRLAENAWSELGRWVGINEAVTVDKELPEWDSVPKLLDVVSCLVEHPRVRAARAHVDAEAARVAQRQAQFKPVWQVDLSYGLRSGRHLDGLSRSDFSSATVSVSMPWFAKRQNQEYVAAARALENAAEQVRLGLLRDMHTDVAKAYGDWQASSERLMLLRDAIVPQSESHAKAVLQAYQNKEGSYTDVLLSYVDEVDAKLDLHRVTIERLQAWAKIDSLNGRSP